MKILTIPDLHGKDLWKSVDISKYEQVIFLGDYVDGWGIPNNPMYNNLKEIIEFADKNSPKTILLIGNHDVQYFFVDGYKRYGCSGYRPEMYYDLHELFWGNRNAFKLAHQVGDHLWTHAGVQAGWHNFEFAKFKKSFWTEEELKYLNLSYMLNEAFKREESVMFHVGWRRGGIHSVGGPLWLDKHYSSKSPLTGYHQIVGHTKVPHVRTYTINKDTTVTYTDCLDENPGQFYTLEL